MTFPERIAAIRKELKLSQEKFGELVGVSQRTVAFWEAGERTPSHSLTTSMADRLGCSVDYLLGRSDEKAQKSPPPQRTTGSGPRLLIASGIFRSRRFFACLIFFQVWKLLKKFQNGRQLLAAQVLDPLYDFFGCHGLSFPPEISCMFSRVIKL